MNVIIQGASPKIVRRVMRNLLRVAWSHSQTGDVFANVLGKILSKCGGYKNFESFRHTVYRGHDSLNELSAELSPDFEQQILRDMAKISCMLNPTAKPKTLARAIWKAYPYGYKNLNSFYHAFYKYFRKA